MFVSAHIIDVRFGSVRFGFVLFCPSNRYLPFWFSIFCLPEYESIICCAKLVIWRKNYQTEKNYPELKWIFEHLDTIIRFLSVYSTISNWNYFIWNIRNYILRFKLFFLKNVPKKMFNPLSLSPSLVYLFNSNWLGLVGQISEVFQMDQ